MKKEQVVVLFGSPRKHGFTSQLVDSFLRKFDPESIQVTYFNAYRLHILPCTDCRQCLKGICPFNQKDDMKQVISAMSDADMIVLASPIYFHNYPTPLKAIIDRTQQFFKNRAENRTKTFPKSAKGFILLTSGVADPDASCSSLIAGKMFLRSINASFEESFLTENTDYLSDPN